MKLIETKTGIELEVTIEKLIKEEIKKLKGNMNFTFAWNLEVENGVYRIKLEDNNKTLGLISLIDYSRELRIHINLIESSKDCRRKTKLIQNIPGCLIAFACQLSFKKGYEGFVSLIPKTELIEYYNEMYGFQNMGTQMAVYYELSNSIIEKYLGNEKV